MLSYRIAKKLLSPGEDVYYHDDGTICAVKVISIHQEYLTVEGAAEFLYDDVAKSWWLTRRGACDALQNRNKGKCS